VSGECGLNFAVGLRTAKIKLGWFNATIDVRGTKFVVLAKNRTRTLSGNKSPSKISNLFQTPFPHLWLSILNKFSIRESHSLTHHDINLMLSHRHWYL
jgi:hypothetical protein